jgi:hypothetical protein
MPGPPSRLFSAAPPRPSRSQPVLGGLYWEHTGSASQYNAAIQCDVTTRSLQAMAAVARWRCVTGRLLWTHHLRRETLRS